MTPPREVELIVQPRLLIDLQDWYRTTYTSPLVPGAPEDDGAIGTSSRSIVRVQSAVRVMALPTNPPDPAWPFAAPMQLLLNETASGVRSFHGRVATGAGIRVRSGAYQLAGRTKCRLEIRARGYEPWTRDEVEIPSVAELLPVRCCPPPTPVPLLTVPMRPDPLYGYPPPPRPTVLWGRVVNAAAQPVDAAEIELASGDTPELNGAAQTGADGTWSISVDLRETVGESGAVLRALKAGQQDEVAVVVRHSKANRIPDLTVT